MADEILWALNTFVIDPYVLRIDNSNNPLIPQTIQQHWLQQQQQPSNNSCRWSPAYSLHRQFLVTWLWLYVGALMIYFSMSCITYWRFYSEVQELQRKAEQSEKQRQQAAAATAAVALSATSPVDVANRNSITSTLSHRNTTTNEAHWHTSYPQLQFEILTSVCSLAVMSLLVCPLELYTLCGHSRVYYNYSDYSSLYLLLSPLLFLLFTDTTIYWIHRSLHTFPWLYKLHKLHHKYKETTPFSAFAFHPIDGFLQGLPYHVFVFVLPMHSRLYAATLVAVGVSALVAAVAAGAGCGG